MEAYLDNSATTRPFDEVTDYMTHLMKDVYGNPSSMHMAGVLAERELKAARQKIARSLKVSEKEIVFTSGGTESDNLAIIGSVCAKKREGMHVLTTKTEHPAVLETMRYLEDCGYTVTYLPVSHDGRLEADTLKKALTEDTILVSVMHVNNETGALNDIATLAEIVKEYNDSVVFHTDAVQSFGKVSLFPKKIKADLVSVSAHKIHGPKGSGFLYISDKVRIIPQIHGGGQQAGLRSGTENVPGIAGTALAAELITNGMADHTDKLYDLKTFFVKQLGNIKDTVVNAIPEGAGATDEAVHMTAPHIVSVSFEGVRAEVLLHALEEKGIYVSAGSACASNKKSRSATLLAMGIDDRLIDSTLRFSFSVMTTKDEIEYTLTVLEDELEKLRRFTRR